MIDQSEHAPRRYVAYGIAAYGLWGLIPLYFKTVTQIAPAEVLANRILWSSLLLVALAGLLGRWRDAWRSLHDGRLVLMLAASAALLAVNWLTFIYAVATNQVLQSSLGYFMGPLVNVLLGVTLLRERLWPLQILSIALAIAGFLVLTVSVGHLPWIALTLALTGSFYGLMRKIAPIDGLLGIMMDTLLVMPLAVAYLGYLTMTAKVTASSPTDLGLLLLSGPVTTVPFLFFAAAARRLRLSTMGILQYLTPSLQFVLAVTVFGELFSTAQLVSFSLIWTAVAIYTADSYRAIRQARLASPIEPLMFDP